jgi:hypothetical protein
MSTNYHINIEKYALRHFIKSFDKKYKRAWAITLEALKRELQSFEVLLLKTIAEIIVAKDEVKIAKVEFKVAGTDDSRHGSGNRCIVAIDNRVKMINILLVYHKSHLGKGNETVRWKQVIKENYPEYRNLL